MSYKGVILVGGPSVGTRFRPLSMDLPKPLFPIAGNPMIYHPLQALAKVPGMKEILIIGFFDQSLFDRFLTEAQIEFPYIQIRYLREYQSMGTAGGIHHFRDEILRGNPDAFFLLNGDIASSFPFQAMLGSHKRSGALATVLGMHMEKKFLSKYGCIAINPKTNQVEHFVEKPESFVSDLISCGIYLFGRDIISHIAVAMENRRQIDNDSGIDLSQFAHKQSLAASNAALSARSGERAGMEQDVLPLLVSKKVLSAYVMSERDFWMAIKTGSSCIEANRRYLQHFLEAQPKRLSTMPTNRNVNSPSLGTPAVSSPATSSPAVASPSLGSPTVGNPYTRSFPEIISPVIIHPTAVVHPSAKIGPNASIGPRALIGKGVRIRDALILDAVEVKNDACILNAVVGWESKIGAWTRIEGSTPQEADTREDSATTKGFKIPSAAILGKAITVADELIIRDCIVLPHKDLKQSFQREILM